MVQPATAAAAVGRRVPFEFRLPDLGEGIQEAQLLAWKVRPGETVAAFQPLCEVESAKAAVELTSPVGGRVLQTRVAEGETAQRGAVLVVIDTDALGGPSSPADAPAATRSTTDAPAATHPTAEARAPTHSTAAAPHALSSMAAAADATPSPGAAPDATPEASDTDAWVGIVGAPPRRDLRSAAAPGPTRVLAAPFVRRLARDLGVRLEDVQGSGPQGRIRIADVEAASRRTGLRGRPAHAAPVDAPAPAGAADVGALPPSMAPEAAGGTAASADTTRTAAADATRSAGPDTARAADADVIPLRGLRKAIADHMVEAMRHAPQVTSMDLVDVTELVAAREAMLASAAVEGIKLSYLPFFLKAAVQALKAVPAANAVLDEAAGLIRLKREYNIGIATAVPGGLVVPVVKHADLRSLLELAAETERLVAAARERRSPPADLADGTFTITSFGGLAGSPLFATPILNYPEVAILGIGRIELQPRVVGGQVVARQCAGVSLTFDHRVLDGEGAGQFMAVLKRYLEHPLELLLHLR